MTPSAQRIAIAESCRWKHDSYGYARIPNVCQHDPEHWVDCLLDLNAMHEAEKQLLDNSELARKYIIALSEPTQEPYKCSWYAHLWHATASQRAEAFLRTLNLWKD
jgi:hypothetical protein